MRNFACLPPCRLFAVLLFAQGLSSPHRREADHRDHSCENKADFFSPFCIIYRTTDKQADKKMLARK